MKLTKVLIAAGATIAIAASAGCSSAAPEKKDPVEPDAGETVTLQVGVSPTISGTGFHAALEAGYFEDEGLEIETTTMQSGSQAIPLLLNGEVQFSIVDVPGTALAVDKGLPIRLIASATFTPAERDSTDGILVRGGSGLDRPRDLEGKTVAVSSLISTPALYLLAGVEADGGNPELVKLVEVPQAGTVDAVLNQTVDAAILFEPFLAQARNAGLQVLAHPGRDAAGGAMQSGYGATVDYLAGNPEIAARFAAAIERGNADIEESIKTDGKFLRDLVSRTTEIAPDVIEAMVLPDYRSGSIDPASVDKMLGLLFRRGYIEKELTAEDLVWNNG